MFTDVANLPLRPPAMMAKAAATLDVLSGGRFDLGLGAGAFPEIVDRLGGPVRTRGEAIDALEEAIDVIRLMWSSEPSVSYEGTYYRLADARPGPPPAHPIGIWLGAFKPRMLRLVGRKADGWLPSLGVLTRDELREANRLIDATAEQAGRDPRSIRRILNLQGMIGDGPAPTRESLPVGYLAGEPLAGPPDFWVETMAGFVGGRLRHARVLAGRDDARPGRAPGAGAGRARGRRAGGTWPPSPATSRLTAAATSMRSWRCSPRTRSSSTSARRGAGSPRSVRGKRARVEVHLHDRGHRDRAGSMMVATGPPAASKVTSRAARQTSSGISRSVAG